VLLAWRFFEYANINQLPDIKYGEAGWISKDPLQQDQGQSRRLHEPTSMIGNVDPITGHDVISVLDHPSVVDGILTIYFESEATRTAYLDTPINHPFSKLPGPPTDEDDRGG